MSTTLNPPPPAPASPPPQYATDGTVAKIKRYDGTILDLPATGSVWLDGSVPA